MTRIDHFLGKENGHTAFDPSIEPALRIKPGTGETIGFQTDDGLYAELHEKKDLGKCEEPINPITGPLFVEGAEPGDTLKVTIHDIELKDYGWSVSLPGSGALAERMGDDVFSRQIPITEGIVQLTDTISTEARPMIGCIGTAPAGKPGSTIMPSFPSGGNMDLTDAGPGATVYLPVEVEGAYLFIGDIHSVMARGESSFVAIETEGTAIVEVDVVKGQKLRAPRIETKDEWCFIGIDDPVQQSIINGYEDLFDFLTVDHGWDKGDAYVVMSALAHSELGGPTGSEDPDPLHPFTAIGAVTVHRLPKSVLRA